VVAFAAPALELEELIVRALADEDTAIRLSAARIARRELSTDALLRLTPRLRSDPYPPVRLEWLGLGIGHAHVRRAYRSARR